MPMFHFYTPWKRQKTKGFLTFSGGIEMEHWHEMGQSVECPAKSVQVPIMTTEPRELTKFWLRWPGFDLLNILGEARD